MSNRMIRAKKNIIFSVFNSTYSILSEFLFRTIIIHVLGISYLGLSGLFSSILQVLNAAELGFSSAIIYNMYRPLALGDSATVNKLLGLYRKIYRIIGIVILIAGVALIPFLDKLISKDVPSDINLEFLYLLYLVNTASSYFFFSYKTALLNAVQRTDLVKASHMFAHTLQYVLQFVSICCFKNYYLFVASAIIGTISSNIIASWFAFKKYPQYICEKGINDSEKKVIKTQVKGLIIEELSGVSRNSFDSIVISLFLGLNMVAIYNNYYLVYSGLCTIISVITFAIRSSVGDSIAVESVEKNYNDLLLFQFIFSWITIWWSSCLIGLYQPFMSLWVGDSLLLTDTSMILFCIYFYVFNMKVIPALYFSGAGLWWHAKYAYLLESLGNLLLNFLLGYYWGINGILFATIFTMFVFSFCIRTVILFRKYFLTSVLDFFKIHFHYFIEMCLCCLVTYLICNSFKEATILNFGVRVLLCLFIPNLILLTFNIRNQNLKKGIKYIKRVIIGKDR